MGEKRVLIPESEFRYTGKTKVFLPGRKPPDSRDEPGKFLKLPDVGSRFSYLKKLKNLSQGEIAHRRKLMLSLARQAKHEPKLKEIMRDALVGTFVSTTYYFRSVEEYIRVHPHGLIGYTKRPRLACLERSIYQAIHQPSTYLLKLEEIQRFYLENQAATTIVTHLCPRLRSLRPLV
jgi:transcriptional regulator with XRE-family HTH domain